MLLYRCSLAETPIPDREGVGGEIELRGRGFPSVPKEVAQNRYLESSAFMP